MRDAKLLLEMLTERIPPRHPARHNIVLVDGTLEISLMTDKVYPLRLDEGDFNRPVQDLVDDICALYDAGWVT